MLTYVVMHRHRLKRIGRCWIRGHSLTWATNVKKCWQVMLPCVDLNWQKHRNAVNMPTYVDTCRKHVLVNLTSWISRQSAKKFQNMLDHAQDTNLMLHVDAWWICKPPMPAQIVSWREYLEARVIFWKRPPAQP
jgi:LPS sulfotransferase NodH